jgi:hypothetical protein
MKALEQLLDNRAMSFGWHQPAKRIHRALHPFLTNRMKPPTRSLNSL